MDDLYIQILSKWYTCTIKYFWCQYVLCDMEDLEDTQDFYEYALPNVFTPGAGKVYMVTNVMNMLREDGTSQTLNLAT